MSAATEPLKPIATPPAFTLESLDPDKPQNKYKVLSALSKAQEKRLRWALSVIAQRWLKDANQKVSDLQCERWLYEFSRKCPDAIVTVLSFFVEPTVAGANHIEELYNNDKLDEEFIDKVAGNFTMSSTMLLLVENQMQIAALEAQVSLLEEQIANSNPKLSETSLTTEEKMEQNSATNGTKGTSSSSEESPAAA